MGVKIRPYRGAWWLFIDHQRQRKSLRVGEGPTGKKAAEVAKTQIEARLALGDTSDFGPAPQGEPVQRFETIANDWLQHYPARFTIRPGTLDRYRSFIQHHLLPYFGPRPITDLTADLIERFIEAKRAPGGALRGKALSDVTLRVGLVVLNLILRRAVRLKLLPSNPMTQVEWRARADRGEQEREHVDPFSVTELRAILAAAPAVDHDFAVMLRVRAQSGMRVGEACGLQRQDLDMAAGTARIQRTFSRGRLGPPKRERNWPVSFLHPITEETTEWRPGVTAESRSVLAGLKALKVQAIASEGWVFQRAGRPWPSVSVNTTWRRVLAKAGVRYREPEQLRHTWASIMLSRNAPLPYVQQQGGWRNATVLLRVYARWIPQHFDLPHPGKLPGDLSAQP